MKRFTQLALAVGLPALAASSAVLYFNRRPARRIPPAEHLVVSPADGRVIHIEHADSSQIAFFKHDVKNVLDLVELKPPFQIVVIELHLGNVHVQRAPIAGKVIGSHYYPGRKANVLHSANRERMVNSNEKLLTVIASPRGAVGVVQVAGLAARRIIKFAGLGADVVKGQEIGLITFGSQVVLILPARATLQLAVGARVTDGETVVAHL